MALIIRMRQQGSKGEQKFRIVVTDVRYPRDGKYKEKLGWYNPTDTGEKNYHLDVSRLQFWIDHGAQVSDRVRALVKAASPDVIKQMTAKEVAKREKSRAKRKKNKKK